MDVNTDTLKVQHSERARPSIRDRLIKIEPKTADPEHIQWLWEQVMKEDYATDDIGAATPELFISNLFLGNSTHWEYEGSAYIAALNIIDRVNADLHFAVWGDVPLKEVSECHAIICDELFEQHDLNRITAYVPAFNKKMLRFATILGYKYEGEIREIFLKNGTYFNMFVYGLLKKDYVRRKGGI